MADKKQDKTTIEDLIAKEGILVKRNGVWSNPSEPLDPSGTNLKLPLNYVSANEVDAAIKDGSLVVAAAGADGMATAVALPAKEGEARRVIVPASIAGTAEAGTELPPNSRPTHDAGSAPISPREAEQAVIDRAKAMGAKDALAMGPGSGAAPTAAEASKASASADSGKK